MYDMKQTLREMNYTMRDMKQNMDDKGPMKRDKRI